MFQELANGVRGSSWSTDHPGTSEGLTQDIIAKILEECAKMFNGGVPVERLSVYASEITAKEVVEPERTTSKAKPAIKSRSLRDYENELMSANSNLEVSAMFRDSKQQLIAKMMRGQTE